MSLYSCNINIIILVFIDVISSFLWLSLLIFHGKSFMLFPYTYFAAVVSVGAALFLLQQMAGINAVVYYSTSVFRSAGITSDVAASALVGAANVFG